MMNEHLIEPVLTEILEDIIELSRKVEGARKINEQVCELLSSFDKKLSDVKINAPAIDLGPVNEKIENGVLEIKTTLDAQPKTIKRDCNFHLFPKINIKEYYQTYSKLVLYGTIFLLAAGLVNIGWEWIDGYNKRQDDLEQVEALKQYEENELQLDIKRNKEKLDVSRSAEATKIKTANDKVAFKKKQLMDSIKTGLEKKIEHYLNYSLHK